MNTLRQATGSHLMYDQEARRLHKLLLQVVDVPHCSRFNLRVLNFA